MERNSTTGDSPTHTLRRARRVVCAMGPRWLAYRMWYAVQQKTGLLRRAMPALDWDELPIRTTLAGDQASSFGSRWLDAPPPFFFSPRNEHWRAEMRSHLVGWDAGRTATEQSDDIASGRWDVFGAKCHAAFPPRWSCEPGSDSQPYPDAHWTTLNEFQRGDIKRVWEPARFSSAFAFARADMQAGDEEGAETHAERFWTMVDSFYHHNPPNRGPHWKCGQECAIRIMGCCFGLYAFLTRRATTPARVERLAQLAAATAQRIQGNIQYALHQYNNHGISEAAGLFTVGLVFPQLTHSGKWVRLGKQLLERQVRELIYDDGAFSQHSANYHRLMLQLMVWCVRLGQLHNQHFDTVTLDRLKRATDFLWQLQDDQSGELPNYGENDGALLLPLSACGPRDYRPVIQSASIAFQQQRRYDTGPWDEEAVWLHGSEALSAPLNTAAQTDFRGGLGGCHTLRSASGMAAIRCTPSYRHRPGHCDALHVDVWWRGLNIALDPGTYSYNSPAPWNHPLAEATYHNTVVVDGRSPMERTSRFLYTPWIRGHVNEHCGWEKLGLWEGTHEGFRRDGLAAGYRRAVLRLGDEHWLVIDDLRSTQVHDYRLHWLFRDLPHHWNAGDQRLTLETPLGPYQAQIEIQTQQRDRAEEATGCDETVDLARASDGPRGWEAPSYGQRRPALSLVSSCRATDAQFATVLGPPNVVEDLQLRWTSSRQLTALAGDQQYTIQLSGPEDGALPTQDKHRLIACVEQSRCGTTTTRIEFPRTRATGRAA